MSAPNRLIHKPSYPITPYRVLVLMGGWSHEREVSFEGGKGVAKALNTLGHDVETLDPPRDVGELVASIRSSFKGQGPERIFNLLHGRWGEDGTFQAFLDMMGIPYTASSMIASAMGMDKHVTRQMAIGHGIPCPPGETLSLATYQQNGWGPFPYVIKPLCEGSTYGIKLIHNREEERHALDNWVYGDRVVLEQYIPGREIQVAVFGGKAMGSVEIVFDEEIFSYESKYIVGKAEHLIPAPLEEGIHNAILDAAEKAHILLGCGGVTRSDFRYNDKGTGSFYYLETNTQPGFTANSLVPDIAKHYGWSYEDVVQWVLEDAACQN